MYTVKLKLVKPKYLDVDTDIMIVHKTYNELENVLKCGEWVKENFKDNWQFYSLTITTG